jgi:hypothetical protein
MSLPPFLFALSGPPHSDAVRAPRASNGPLPGGVSITASAPRRLGSAKGLAKPACGSPPLSLPPSGSPPLTPRPSGVTRSATRKGIGR